MAVDGLVELKFRLADGSDIGPSKYSSDTTVTTLKETIISQWPQGLYIVFFPCFMCVLGCSSVNCGSCWGFNGSAE